MFTAVNIFSESWYTWCSVSSMPEVPTAVVGRLCRLVHRTIAKMRPAVARSSGKNLLSRLAAPLHAVMSASLAPRCGRNLRLVKSTIAHRRFGTHSNRSDWLGWVQGSRSAQSAREGAQVAVPLSNNRPPATMSSTLARLSRRCLLKDAFLVTTDGGRSKKRTCIPSRTGRSFAT